MAMLVYRSVVSKVQASFYEVAQFQKPHVAVDTSSSVLMVMKDLQRRERKGSSRRWIFCGQDVPD